MPLGHGFLVIYFCVMILQLAFAATALSQRFMLLNDNLHFTFKDQLSKDKVLVNIHSGVTNIPKHITELYSSLCCGIDLANETFTFQIISYAMYFVVSYIFTVYAIIRELILQSDFLMTLLIINSSWLILYMIILAIALHSGHCLAKCAQQTPVIVSSVLKNPKWQQECLRRVFKTFLLEVQYRSLCLENVFFRIEWKLLFSVSCYGNVVQK
jgi:7tm Chemosensory receptor